MKIEFGYVFKTVKARFKISNPIVECSCTDCFMIAGKSVVLTTKAKAICSPQDKFNEEFGMALANVRCRVKANKRLEQKLIEYSNKKSEKTEFDITPNELKMLKGIYGRLKKFYEDNPEYKKFLKS